MTLLSIRPEQIAALDHGAPTFRAAMRGHLRSCFREECGALDDDALDELVDHGVAKGARYGVLARRDVCLLIDLMCTFGRDFDLDPALPWAGRILGGCRSRGPTLQLQRLARHAARRLHEAHGLSPAGVRR